MKCLGIAILALFLSISTVNAKRKFLTEGFGPKSCKQYLASLAIGDPEDTRLLFYTWAQGFMTGLNLLVKYQERIEFNSIPIDTQKKMIEATCMNHIDWYYMDSVLALYDFMRSKKDLSGLEIDLRE